MKLQTLVIIAAAAIAFSACGKKDEQKPAQAAASAAGEGLKIAYIDVDSLQAKYDFFNEKKAEFEAKMQSYQAQIQQKENALAQLQNSIQTRMQNGQISSEAQYKQEMQKYEQQQNAYAKLSQTAQEEMAALQNGFNEALTDSIEHYLAEYNKAKKFAVILNKAAALYAAPALDITDDVVAGLNKRYKKSK